MSVDKNAINNEKNIIYDFFKERFFFELQRREHLKNNLSLPISLFVVIFGIIFYFLQNIDTTLYKYDVISDLFMISFFITISLIILCLYFLIRSFYNYRYSFLPDPESLNNYFNKNEAYHKKTSSKTKQAKNFHEDTQEQIKNWYIEGAQNNLIINDRRSGFIHWATTMLIASLISTFICSSFFYIKHTQLKLSQNYKEIKMGNNEKNPPPKVEKPKPPPIRQIKENTIPKPKIIKKGNG